VSSVTLPCTIKYRRFPLAPAHPGGPSTRAIKRLCVCVSVCVRACVCIFYFKDIVSKRGSIISQLNKQAADPACNTIQKLIRFTETI